LKDIDFQQIKRKIERKKKMKRMTKEKIERYYKSKDIKEEIKKKN
jgi:hypothetical protein